MGTYIRLSEFSVLLKIVTTPNNIDQFIKLDVGGNKMDEDASEAMRELLAHYNCNIEELGMIFSNNEHDLDIIFRNISFEQQLNDDVTSSIKLYPTQEPSKVNHIANPAGLNVKPLISQRSTHSFVGVQASPVLAQGGR